MSGSRVGFWFRNDLRVIDNEAWSETMQLGMTHLLPFYLHDRETAPVPEGWLRQCLVDLDHYLGSLDLLVWRDRGRGAGSVARRVEMVEKLMREYQLDLLVVNSDPEYLEVDEQLGDRIQSYHGGDLVDRESWPEKTLDSFSKTRSYLCQDGRIAAAMAKPRYPSGLHGVPHRGGWDEWKKTERVSLRRSGWATYRAFREQIPQFRKPETSPTAIPTSTSRLSHYLARGVLGPRELWWRIQEDCGDLPVDQRSYLGQLIWRQMYRFSAYADPNFHRTKGNRLAESYGYSYRQNRAFRAWRDGETGYPWIDAIMTQLREEGWIHHLARHATACFLTRGDLYRHWELGRDVFDYYLIDRDYSLNNGNWMWVSAVAFFHAYFRVYSPITYARGWDRNGGYVRHYLPVLEELPAEWIYCPSQAPREVLQEAGVTLGIDYPEPIVDHDQAKEENMRKIRRAKETS